MGRPSHLASGDRVTPEFNYARGRRLLPRPLSRDAGRLKISKTTTAPYEVTRMTEA